MLILLSLLEIWVRVQALALNKGIIYSSILSDSYGIVPPPSGHKCQLLTLTVNAMGEEEHLMSCCSEVKRGKR